MKPKAMFEVIVEAVYNISTDNMISTGAGSWLIFCPLVK